LKVNDMDVNRCALPLHYGMNCCCVYVYHMLLLADMTLRV
jgi:hypothetical protein